MPINILYIISTLGRSGPTGQLLNLVKYLDRTVFEPSILTLSGEPRDSMQPHFIRLEIPIQSLKLNRLRGFFRAGRRLSEKAAALKPDLIHTCGLRSDILAQKHLTAYRRILTVRNYPFLDYPMKFGRIRGTLMSRFHLHAIRRCPVAVACSQSLADMFRIHHNCTLRVIPNGVDFTGIEQTKEKKSILRQQYGIPEDFTVFVSTGGLLTRKDPQTIIHAFDKVTGQNSTLLFVGDGPLASILSRQTLPTRRFLFVGKQPNVWDFLQMSDFFISASLAEGLPNAVLEAMACGLPCLLSDIAPHREILSYAPQAGILFAPRDINALCKLMGNAYSRTQYMQMSRAAQEIVTRHLNAKMMSEAYQKLYLSMLQP